MRSDIKPNKAQVIRYDEQPAPAKCFLPPLIKGGHFDTSGSYELIWDEDDRPSCLTAIFTYFPDRPHDKPIRILFGYMLVKPYYGRLSR